MSKYGYLEVFQRVPWTSRYRESTVFLFFILFNGSHDLIGLIINGGWMDDWLFSSILLMFG